MINDYLNIQKRINYYNCYIKHIVAGFSEEFQTNKIYIKRLIPILDRLLVNEKESFLNFFNDKKAMELIQYITQQGEILHLGDGFYSLPPERAIQMPDGRYFGISLLNEKLDNSTGTATNINNPSSLVLTYEEYMFRPSFNDLLNIYIKKLTDNHDVEPDELIFFTKQGIYKSSKVTTIRENEYYILSFNRVIGGKVKPEKYFAQWKDGKWYVAEIKNDYIRLRLALSSFKGRTITYKLVQKENGYIELRLPFSLPKEEHIILCLIATPQEFKWPKRYLITTDQLTNVKTILSLCQLESEEV